MATVHDKSYCRWERCEICTIRNFEREREDIHKIFMIVYCSHFLLQGIFLTQGSNPGFLHCGWILYRLNHWGSLKHLSIQF